MIHEDRTVSSLRRMQAHPFRVLIAVPVAVRTFLEPRKTLMDLPVNFGCAVLLDLGGFFYNGR